MFLPYDSDQPKHQVSWATHGLVLANVLAFLLVVTRRDPDATALRWAFDPRSPGPITWLTSMFMHAGVAHLVGNMLFLHIAGRPLEWRLGRLPFLGLYFLSGVVATIVQAIASPLPSLGASGAIAGLLGAWLWLLPSAQVSMVYFWGFWWYGKLEVQAAWLLVFWAGEQALCAKIFGDASGVAYAAHLGGFGAGFALALLASRFPFLRPACVLEEEKRQQEKIQSLGAWKREPLLVRPLDSREQIVECVTRGEAGRLARLYVQADRRGERPVLTPRSQEELAGLLLSAGATALAALALEDLASQHPGTREAQRAERLLARPKKTAATP